MVLVVFDVAEIVALGKVPAVCVCRQRKLERRDAEDSDKNRPGLLHVDEAGGCAAEPVQDRCHRIGQKRTVVTYRLLTSGSVEIDIMKKQISKKKLERLTIHGGDYRQAGRRQSKAVTIDDLRLLLEDDVKV